MFINHVLTEIQGKPSEKGYIINVKGKSRRIKLEESYKVITPLLEPLQEWLNESSPEEPPVILNKHCPLCQFRERCQAQAIQEDNLSRLDRITPKSIRQYERKGIFTVKQLSYLFKPRKRKKRAKNPPPITHNIELQALAIRTGKIYIQELPVLTRQETELYLDIEGLPDQNLHYLIGVLVCDGNSASHHSFWANSIENESEMLQEFLTFVAQYPDAPIYHYGSYEVKALKQLSKRYDTKVGKFLQRLNNLNSCIYGKIYFPVYSNGLKELGGFIGAKWSSPDASGLQSLVWRHQWEKKQDTNFKIILIQYNQEDCQALKSFLDYLFEIIRESENRESENSDKTLIVDQYKEKITPTQKETSGQFKKIFKLAHFGYDQKKISFSQTEELSKEDRIRKRQENSRNARKGQHKKELDRKRRAKRKIQVPDGKICPRCNHEPLKRSNVISKRYIIDLILMKNGMRKVVTEYYGFKGYCTKCQRNYIPPGIRKYGIKQAYDHGIGAWIVYQRVELRLSYENIVKSIKEQFNESICLSFCVNMINRFASIYTETKKLILRNLLQSPFIHADETRANIRGENWYVWVFTDGKNTIYQLHQTREGEIAQVFFANYAGVVISDFYAGYDSVKCDQQKCWIHLIRDLNNDLQNNPFDKEFEELIISVRNLIVPIMKAVIKFGLKKRHLRKFEKHVDKFYKNSIDNKVFKSDIAQRYQKRFIRYRSSLFLFLKKDGIPWHNNTAEHAAKHFAKQRDSSGPMFESVAQNYLTLLSIHQTCCNQNKSFLQFLFSEEKDIYSFNRYKR
jgi:predicted RecB family nuclease